MDKKSERRSRSQTPDRLDASGHPHEQRRGSNLLAAAGIGYEQRRRLSQQTAEAHGDGRVFQQGSQLFIEDKEGHVTRLEVVEVKEKMGLLRKAVPTLPVCFAVLFLVFNTLLPGTGTILGALSLLCCGRCRHESSSLGIKYGLIAAALQIVTAVFIVGWIYSIYYGVNMLQDSLTKDERGNITEEATKDIGVDKTEDIKMDPVQNV